LYLINISIKDRGEFKFDKLCWWGLVWDFTLPGVSPFSIFFVEQKKKKKKKKKKKTYKKKKKKKKIKKIKKKKKKKKWNVNT
jgi:hypothetical protein